MGFLSSIFGSSEEEDDYEQEDDHEEEDRASFAPVSAALPDFKVGMSLDVTILNGPPLLSGRLTAFTARELTIERKPGQISFSTCPLNKEVMVRGVAGGRPFDLKGFIEESTRMKCRIKDFKVIPYNENRTNFRLPLGIPITLYDPDDSLLENPEEAELVDISVTGACFLSEYVHGEGEVLRMKVQIEDYIPRVMLGEVVRVSDAADDKFRYGFLFAQLDDLEASTLTKELFNVQVGNKRERRRDGPGHW